MLLAETITPAAPPTPVSTLVTMDGDAPAAASTPAAARDVLGERYSFVRLLGSGGFGEVLLVHDQQLGRNVAMKLLRPDMFSSAEIRTRFLAEIHLTARLSHPGIVAVYDAGALPSGQLWYTMPEVRGRTFRNVVDKTFAGGQPRRRLIDLYARACDAIAYAHGKAIVHRDIKPDNIMIGEHGEVLVMDWGIAHLRSQPEPSSDAPPSSSVSSLPPMTPLHTRIGAVLGTPGYMAPEQARGEPDRIGPATDVYALGALLLYTLTGESPRPSRRIREVSQELRLQLTALDNDPDVEPELAAICQHAMALEPADRYPDAGALAQEIRAFLDGARRREQALATLTQARMQADALEALRSRAGEARAAARRVLATVRPSDPVEKKEPGWELEDQAEQLERELALGETEWIQLVHGALAKDPGLPEAHEALADHYRDKLIEAERAGRTADAVRCEVLLRAHDRGKHAAVLRGDGALTLVTDPPGAEVLVQRYVLRQRRLVAVEQRLLGSSPLIEVPLPAGSYLLTLRAPGHTEVRYPVAIERGDNWDGCAPGQKEPHVISLPPAGALEVNEVLVPAGWAWTGGDTDAADALPRRRVWIDAFVMRRYPVTYAELLSMLNDRQTSGLANAELEFSAAGSRLIDSGARTPALATNADGLYVLSTDATTQQQLAQPLWPASISWLDAVACARFHATRTGRPYRLPNELEREKACRGVDGRFFAWGNQAEPVFACSLGSHREQPQPAPITGHSTDESPYGIRGLSGNVRDWCANVWRHDGPHIDGDRLVLQEAPLDSNDFRSVRGGFWGSPIAHSRAAARFAGRPGVRRQSVGFRLVRSWPGSSGS